MSRERTDYKKLLQEILPVDSLAQPLRRLVGESVAGGDPNHLWKTTTLVLEALCGLGLFVRGDESRCEPGEVVYHRRDDEPMTVTISPPEPGAPRYAFPVRPALSPDIAGMGKGSSLEALLTGVATRLSDEELGASLLEILDYIDEILSPLAVHVILYEEGEETALDDDWPTGFAHRLRPHFESGGDAVYVPDLGAEAAMAELLRPGAAAVVSLPLRAGKEMFGVLEVLHGSTEPFGENELGVLSLLALLAAGRIRNAKKLEKLIYIDILTGVFSRRFFEEQILREVERANRDVTPLALVLVDLDNFKEINDTHGHLAGDRVLSSIGGLLNENVRRIDLVTRFGGEEFAILLPGATHDQAAMICERLRSLVEELPVPVGGESPLRLTTSIGIALYPEHTGDQSELRAVREELLAKADRALYAAKSSGKNRVVFWAGEASE